MRPAKRLQHLVGFWVLIGLAAAVWPQFRLLWFACAGIVVVVALVDLLALLRLRPLVIERDLPGRFALGVPSEVGITLRNPGRLPARVTVFDGLPGIAESEHLPWTGEVPAGQFHRIDYTVQFRERGPQDFTPVDILRHSPLGLWQRRLFVGEPGSTRVYPNYEPVLRFAMLAMENRQDVMGIHRRNLRGASREFHQLREYHLGDRLNQIDWKATSRRLQLISREYREQKDQNVILMIDSGRRMRAMDGELSQFDHCLNAALLLAYIALRQGDQVGIIGFGGNERWIPPVKGQHAMTALLNHLYDYRSTLGASDFSEAAEKLLLRQKRRGLVIVLTNLRSEDADEVIPAMHLIQGRHLVLLSSLREARVEARARQPVRELDDALLVGATHLYLEDRERVLGTLRSHGVLTVDETAQRLPVTLVNTYLDVKQSGRL